MKYREIAERINYYITNMTLYTFFSLRGKDSEVLHTYEDLNSEVSEHRYGQRQLCLSSKDVTEQLSLGDTFD